MLFEQLIEVRHVLITGFVGCFSDGEIGGLQQVARVAHTNALKILQRSLSAGVFKAAIERAHAHLAVFGDTPNRHDIMTGSTADGRDE